MKRSEMIAAIDKKLRGTPIDHDNFALQFLNIAEELGMAPPETHILKNAYDRANGQMGFWVHEWDDEDEN